MKRIFSFIILSVFSLSLAGQLTPVTNQYILNPLLINPSCAGSRGALDIAAFYRRQWLGIAGAPQTITLAIDAPILSSKLGLGLLIVNDKIGVTKETQYMAAYAFRINLGDGYLSFGLGTGILTTNTAWSELVVIDPGDEFYLIDSKVFVVPEFSFGTYLNYHNFFAGFSIPRLLSYKFDFNRNKYSIVLQAEDYNYILNTGYMFEIASKTKFFPSVLLTFSPGARLLYDINAHFSFFDRFWLGASYHNTHSITGLAQFAINNQLKIAYSYDYDFSKIGNFSSGSHEIMLRYEFHYKVDVASPLIF
jgi:type IX secretion system PorP/SprF family membrane protein